MITELLLILSVRFLIFDHKTLRPIRWWLWKKDKTKLLRTLLECTYCQGFWLAVGYELVNWDTDLNFDFCLVAALVSYLWAIVVYPLSEEAEEISHKMRLPGDKDENT